MTPDPHHDVSVKPEGEVSPASVTLILDETGSMSFCRMPSQPAGGMIGETLQGHGSR